ncbi:MAG: hypothetical protein RL885_08405 [Planctomycetota bacterium]
MTVCRLLLSFGILGSFLFACGGEEASIDATGLTPEQRLKQAQILVDQNELTDAAGYLTSLVDSEGLSESLRTKALFGAAICQAKMGSGTGLKRRLDRLEEAAPEGLDAAFYVGLGQQLLHAKSIGAARDTVARGKLRYPAEEAAFEKIDNDLALLAKAGDSIKALESLGYIGAKKGGPAGIDVASYWN